MILVEGYFERNKPTSSFRKLEQLLNHLITHRNGAVPEVPEVPGASRSHQLDDPGPRQAPTTDSDGSASPAGAAAPRGARRGNAIDQTPSDVLRLSRQRGQRPSCGGPASKTITLSSGSEAQYTAEALCVFHNPSLAHTCTQFSSWAGILTSMFGIFLVLEHYRCYGCAGITVC